MLVASYFTPHLLWYDQEALAPLLLDILEQMRGRYWIIQFWERGPEFGNHTVRVLYKDVLSDPDYSYQDFSTF